MSNRILSAICGIALLTCCGLTGCSMCCGPYDFHYPVFGGKLQRVDPTYGRVGSIFSDPNAGMFGPSADSNLEPQPVDSMPSVPRDDPEDDLNIDDDLESIEPRNENLDGDVDELPNPKQRDNKTTASRIWRQRPSGNGPAWR